MALLAGGRGWRLSTGAIGFADGAREVPANRFDRSATVTVRIELDYH